jgi:hypothetical protein
LEPLGDLAIYEIPWQETASRSKSAARPLRFNNNNGIGPNGSAEKVTAPISAVNFR